MPKPLNLKQRLSALSNPNSGNYSTGSINTQSQKSLSNRTIRNPFPLGAIWGRRDHDSALLYDEPSTREQVQEVMESIIFQAGVDHETRPMVILNASAFPDPQEVSYDALLSAVLAHLSLFVESDYTLVFFAAGGRHTPGWNWVWKAYRSLNRTYRKNLKRLLIVHSTFFSKMLFSLAGATISPKFFRKITYVNTLSDLALYVPLTQIDISSAVYQENLKHEREITLPNPTASAVFGVPLEDIMGIDGEKSGIPNVIRDCSAYLREFGLEQEGLFRRSPRSIMLKQAQEAYDRGQLVTLKNFQDPHLAAVLIKKYLRDLPTPIFTENMYDIIRKCPLDRIEDEQVAIQYIQNAIIPVLPPCSLILLSHILQLMNDVSLRTSINLMDARNLTIVLCPNLVRSAHPAQDIAMCAVPAGHSLKGETTVGGLIKFCIERYYLVFDEIRDRSDALPPPRPLLISSDKISESGSSTKRRSNDYEEDVDDAMLVMPIESSSPTTAYYWKPRHREQQSGSVSKSRSMSVRSMHTDEGEIGSENAHSGTVHRTRSFITFEKDKSSRGAITIGRAGSGTKKASGAPVEALSISASGFFSPPNEGYPMPGSMP